MQTFWFVGLIPAALRLAPGATAGALLLLALTALFTLGLARVFPERRSPVLAVTLLAWTAVSWILRDRLHLIGDAQLWLHSAEALGLRTPGYREPLALFLQMAITTATRGWWPTASVVAALSCLCGALSLVALWRYAGPRTPPVRLAAYALLLYGAPLGLLFFGHIETYPLFAAGLALALPLFRAEFERGRPGWRSAGALALLAGLHITGLLLAPALLLAHLARYRMSVRRTLQLSLGLFVAGGVGAGLVPGLAADSTLGHRWTPVTLGDYASELANGWALLLLPLTLLLARAGRRIGRTPMSRFLSLSALYFVLLPTIGLFKLGLYRDLDLLGAAFILLVFLAVECDAQEPSRAAAGFGFHGALGVPLLAALLALNRTPGGMTYFAERLASSRADAAGRAYGYESLARAQRERQEFGPGRQSVERAIALVPTNTRLYGLLGELTLAQGDTAQALTEMARALQSNRAGDVRALMAGLELKRGHARAAVNLLAEDSLDVPAGAAASATLATAYYALGRPDSTLWACDRRLALVPDDARAHANRAAGLMALRRPVEALAELEQAAYLDPAPDIVRQRDRLRGMLGGAGGR